MRRNLTHRWIALLGVFLLAGCHSGPLGRPVIVGASASAGFGSQVTASDGKTYLADMNAVYDAAVLAGHDDPEFLADAAFFLDARASVRRQLDAAIKAEPSVVVGFDFLFWSVYSPPPAQIAGGAETARREAVRGVLRDLEVFSCPLMLGDIPDMRGAIGSMLAASQVPPPDELAALNDILHTWAATRPNVVIVPLSQLNQAAMGGPPLTVGGVIYAGDSAAQLLQADHLHPTTEGLVVMFLAGLEAMQSRGIIKSDEYANDPARVLAAIPAAAREIDEKRKDSGIFTLLSIKDEADAFDAALDRKDCQAAGKHFDTIIEQATHIKAQLDGWVEIQATLLLLRYRFTCPDYLQHLNTWRNRLRPQINVSRPDPWLLHLWSRLSSSAGASPEITARMVRMREELGDIGKEYDSVLDDAISAAKRNDSRSLLTLAPDVRARVRFIIQSMERYNLSTLTRGDSPEDRELRQSYWRYYQESKDAHFTTPEEDAEQMISIERLRLQDQARYADDAALWEFACREQGRIEDAAWISSQFETMVGTEVWAQSRAQARDPNERRNHLP